MLQLLPLSNTFPPAKRTNCFVIGDAPNNIVAIDPSPCDENEYQKLKRTISKYPIDFIFLTHHHPDHHEFSTVLARELGVGMGMSKDSFGRITQEFGPDYFQGIELTFYKEGDVLTRCSGEDVTVYETPGHDEANLVSFQLQKVGNPK